MPPHSHRLPISADWWTMNDCPPVDCFVYSLSNINHWSRCGVDNDNDTDQRSKKVGVVMHRRPNIRVQQNDYRVTLYQTRINYFLTYLLTSPFSPLHVMYCIWMYTDTHTHTHIERFVFLSNALQLTQLNKNTSQLVLIVVNSCLVSVIDAFVSKVRWLGQ